jgi:large conductance mechanosensitive channel
MVKEFRQFITKGNLVTLAVGFIMGVAFSAIVSSLVEDVIMPIVAVPFGQPDFTALTWTVNDSDIRWGAFVTSAIVFLLTALAVFFFIVKPYNALEARMAEDDETEEETGPSATELLTEIRDLLSRQ